LVEHLRDQSGQQGAGQFKARVGVELDEPGIEISIDHEIHAKNFEVMFLSLWRQLDEGALDGIEGNCFHFGQNHILKVILILVVGIKIFLKVSIGDLVSCLIFSIERSVFLDGIVGEMDFSVEVEDVEFIGSSADVSLFEPEGFEDAMQLGHH
jgi:hypothetical protein